MGIQMAIRCRIRFEFFQELGASSSDSYRHVLHDNVGLSEALPTNRESITGTTGTYSWFARCLAAILQSLQQSQPGNYLFAQMQPT
jgi:hypothetical protein